jgi:hypothetical protein
MKTQREIKEKWQELQNIIEIAKVKIKVLQAACKHPNTFQGEYSYKPGSMQDVIICQDCGSILKLVRDYTLTEGK